MTFGQWLKHKREEAGLSQGDVGKILGIQAQSISNWERGEARPPIVAQDKLARIYKVSERDFQMKALEEHLRLAKEKFETKR